MSISLNLGVWGDIFPVPACIADEHLKIAGESQLKVILYLLRNSGKNYTYEEISDTLLIHHDDVKDCVQFWIDRGVICKNGDTLKPVQGADSTITETEPARDLKPQRHVAPPRAVKPDIVSAAQRVAADEALQFVLSEVEIALAKPLSSGDTATIVMLYDTCGLPTEVIMMLVNYCVSINKGNMRTIERIGVQWADEGVNTIESAENKIMFTRQSTANWNKVSTAFELKNVGSPTKKQLEYADLWVGKWHFSDVMLRKAYEACVDNTGKMSMAYIGKILTRWNNAGIYVPEDIAKLDNKKQKPKSNASYDIEDLEKIQGV